MTDCIVKRTTLIVADADRSIAFYRDVLGLKEYYNQHMTVSGNIIPAGEPGAYVHLGILEGPDPEVGKLGVLQWKDPPLAPRRAATRLGIGDLSIVTETDDMEGLYQRLKASSDCRIHCPPQNWEVPRGDGTQRPLQTLSFFDPDGFFWEVNHKAAEPQPEGLVIRRTTLLVNDLSESVKFYGETLGLTVHQDITMTLDGKILPAGPADAQVRMVVMRGQSEETGMVGLLHFHKPNLPPRRRGERTLGIGDSLFVAGAQDQDIHTLCERITQSAGRLHAPPRADEVTGANGMTIKLTTLSLFDPDGFFMELNERRTLQKE